MLSREQMIHRSPGEDDEADRSRRRGRARRDALPLAGAWWKFALLAAGVVTVAAFLLFNRGAVVEPRLHLVFFSVPRPGLLTVLLVTSFVSAAGALLARSALHAMSRPADLPRTPVAPPPRQARTAEPLLTSGT
jgi:hypothetical protein